MNFVYVSGNIFSFFMQNIILSTYYMPSTRDTKVKSQAPLRERTLRHRRWFIAQGQLFFSAMRDVLYICAIQYGSP